MWFLLLLETLREHARKPAALRLLETFTPIKKLANVRRTTLAQSSGF